MSNFDIPFRDGSASEKVLATSSALSSALYLKNGSSVFNADSSNFWSAITGVNQGGSNRGFSTATAFVANEFKTIATFNGSGYLTNIITPTTATTTQFIIRITKDDEVFTSSGIQISSSRRLILGPIVAGQPTATNGANTGFNNQQSDGFSAQPRLSIVPPVQAMQLSELVSFERSLTVEISSNQNIPPNNQNARAGVLLINDFGLRL